MFIFQIAAKYYKQNKELVDNKVKEKAWRKHYAEYVRKDFNKLLMLELEPMPIELFIAYELKYERGI
jgi:hypothetical protein